MDPLFVNPVNGDYLLQPASPCIDTGDPTSPLDPDGTNTDMGAYYFNQYNGPIWHVSTNGSDQTGTGWEQSPFATIQHGIDASSNTDTVLVQPGTYIENINYSGKNITVASLFITTQDSNYISSTTIDGNSAGSVVTFNNSEDLVTVLCGFTITNGIGSGVFPNSHGGGIMCSDGANPSLENLFLTDNSANLGGGIFCYESSPNLQNVIISNNSVTGYGGGIYCYESNSILHKVTISNNFADYGGGIYFNEANPILQNLTISDNSANFGGGVYCNFSNPSLINSILWNDSPQEIYISSGSVIATYSDIEGGLAGTGNIDRNPLFVDPDNDNYNLFYTFPCIDTGNPSSPLDPDDSRVDMGAYYFDLSNGVPTITAVTDVPNDQGHFVIVTWQRSIWDEAFSAVPIVGYNLWEMYPYELDREIIITNDINKAIQKQDIHFQREDTTWVHIDYIAAMQWEQYSALAETFFDSTNVGDYLSYFFVSAHTPHPSLYISSSVASGYSVDNIAPDETRVNIAQNGNNFSLNWDEVEYGTFQGNSYPELNGIWYKIYVGDSPDFVCDEAQLIDTVTNLNYDYPIPGEEEKKFFKIVVSDQPNEGRSIKRLVRPMESVGDVQKVKKMILMK
ncbi:MAG: hypothetical protein KAT74_07020 [Candidatus Cloacimonetes bacterium]|nr:hypothetical protein [Candidatus Cloacimonadota bacterium]